MQSLLSVVHLGLGTPDRSECNSTFIVTNSKLHQSVLAERCFYLLVCLSLIGSASLMLGEAESSLQCFSHHTTLMRVMPKAMLCRIDQARLIIDRKSVGNQ